METTPLVATVSLLEQVALDAYREAFGCEMPPHIHEKASVTVGLPFASYGAEFLSVSVAAYPTPQRTIYTACCFAGTYTRTFESTVSRIHALEGLRGRINGTGA